MAGAGKKTFVAGEVLTAAQVNDYLMDQAVMRFSGSAARAASITAPTEGMVTYLDDVNQIEFYNGASWVRLEVASDDLRNLVSASGDMLVSIGSGSIVRLPVGPDGTVLHADVTASTGVTWKTVEAGGAAAYFQIANTGVTALPNTLTPGFYRIQTSTTTTWTDQQWRFVDTKGQLFGANITSGAGFFTIPVQVASLNITTGTTPFTVLIEEIVGVTATLLAPPTVNSFTWTELYAGSATFTTASTAASLGVFDVVTGRFTNLGAAASAKTGASVVGVGASLSNIYDVVAVQANPSGVWSTASVTASTRYPFAIYTGNGTYVTPPWSPNADVLVVAGGGGGGGTPGVPGAAGGGAGGALIYSGVPTSGSITVTIGAGGGGGGAGSQSSFGPNTATGGGLGGKHGTPGPVNGGPGGSGGGGGTAGTGVPGQGNPGGTGTSAPFFNSVLNFGGGGGGKGSAGTNASPAGSSGSGGSGSVMYGVMVAVGGSGDAGTRSPAYGSGGPGTTGGGSGVVIVKANT